MEKKLDKVKEVSGKLKETEEKVTEQSFTKDGMTRSIRVREVENGFIVEISEDGYTKTKNGKEWNYARQTWISKINPLTDSDNDGETELGLTTTETIKKALDGLTL